MRRGEKNRRLRVQSEKRVRDAEVWSLAIFLGLIVVLTTAIGFALREANSLYTSRAGEAIALLRPAPVLWYMAAGPVAFAIATLILISSRVRTLLAGPEPPSFSTGWYLFTGKEPGWLKTGAIAFLILCAAALLAGVRKHARLTDRGIVNQAAFGRGEVFHSYSEVKEVMLARHWVSSRHEFGRPSKDRALYVRFTDGEVWSPMTAGLWATSKRSADLASSISARSGVPTTYPAEIFDRAEAWVPETPRCILRRYHRGHICDGIFSAQTKGRRA
jgi:hypothetical protein